MRAQVRQALDDIATVAKREAFAPCCPAWADKWATWCSSCTTLPIPGSSWPRATAEPHPVTNTVQESRLYHPDLLIEIAAIAEIPRDRFRRFPINPEATP